jgi:Mrp family chromosome partitioning ATPase
LIDGDLRKPSICRAFDLPAEPGLSEVLRAEVTLETALLPTTISDLFVLPAGVCDERATQRLARGEIGPIFTRLKEQFDYVIVDSSPLLAVTDGLLLAKHADAVLFSILREVSRVPMVQAAYQRLTMIGVHVLGAVMTGVSDGLYGDHYRYYPNGTRRPTPSANGESGEVS